jgi:hypothetical protein
MDRRSVLAATVALPAWLSLGFAQSAKTTSVGVDIKAAVARARSVGKPLLVLLVPADPMQVNLHGQMWGQYLAQLSDDQALDLVLCEVTCARATDIASVIKGGRLDGVDETTWAVLLETDSDPASAVLVRGTLPPLTGNMAEDASKELRTMLAKHLHKAIVPDAAAQQRRIAQCEPVMPDGKQIGAIDADNDYARFEGIGSDGPVRRSDLDRWAALVRFAQVPAMGEPARPDRKPMLADAARIRLFENAPEGAQWMAYSSYCPPCGMGRVPPASRFFLKFYVQ